MYNQTEDTRGIKTVAIIVIIAFFTLAVMNIYEVML
jgi:hypothetical protein